MINYIIINGTNSNTINGLGINELPPISKPPLRVQTEEIDGRDGDISTNLGYGAYDKTISIGLFGTGYDINEVISFFNGEGTVVFSNEPDKYYKYKIINQIDYEALLKFKSASITFHCQPFKYPLEETPLEIEYEYIEQEGVESATMNNTNGGTSLKIDLKGNTSQTGTPTPDTPIPINVVSGDNEVVVCGKNLLEPSSFAQKVIDTPYNSSNVSTYDSTTGALTIKMGNGNSVFDDFKENTQYTIILKMASTTNELNLAVDYTDGTHTYIRAGSGGYTGTKVYVSDIGKTIRQISHNAGDSSGTRTLYLKESGIFEGVLTGSDFEPYQSQTYPIYLGVENLLNIPDGTYSNKGITAVVSNGEITLNDTATDTSTIYIPVNVNVTAQKYTWSANNSVANSNVILRFDTTIMPENLSVVNRTFSYTFSEAQTLTNLCIRTANGTTLTNFKIKPQLEAGTKANSYSPFGQTPIKMRGIGTYEDYFIKGTGKNLAQYIAGWIRSDGVFISSGDDSFYFPVIEGETYIFNTSGNRTLSAIYNDIPTHGASCIPNTYITLTKNTPFQASATGYMVIYANTPTSQAVINDFIAVKGNEVGIYEPYGAKDKWCKYNAIGEVVLDGSENWDVWNLSSETLQRFYTNLLNKNEAVRGSTEYFLCNRFKYVSSYTTEGFNWSDASGIYKQVVVVINRNRLSSVDDTGMENWVSDNNLMFYYPLKTPYLSLIEDTTLISQLDNIENAMSYEGTTNIGQVNNDKPFLLDLIAMEKGTDEVVINNIGNTYAKPTIALEGTGETDIYLNNTEILKVDLSEKNKITIDTNNMEAYDPTDNSLANRKVIGNYNSMTLPSGNTTMKITGALTKATITDYSRWL